MFGNDFTEAKKNTITNIFWKDVMSAIIDLRKTGN